MAGGFVLVPAQCLPPFTGSAIVGEGILRREQTLLSLTICGLRQMGFQETLVRPGWTAQGEAVTAVPNITGSFLKLSCWDFRKGPQSIRRTWVHRIAHDG